MSSKKKKKQEGMSVSTFLQSYCGVNNKETQMMTHEAVTTFFPELKRTSFEHIQKSPELVSTGKVILVVDAANALAPYFVPEAPMQYSETLNEREKMIESITSSVVRMLKSNERGLIIVERDDSLSNYIIGKTELSEYATIADLEGLATQQSAWNTGIIVRREGVYGYKKLHTGISSNLSELENQAYGITKRSDAIALTVDQGRACFFIEGVITEVKAPAYLRRQLLLHLPDHEVVDVDTKAPEEKKMKYAFQDLSDNELYELMCFYKRMKQMAYYHAARRELTSRTKASKEFKASKNEAKMKILEKEIQGCE